MQRGVQVLGMGGWTVAWFLDQLLYNARRAGGGEGWGGDGRVSIRAVREKCPRRVLRWRRRGTP